MRRVVNRASSGSTAAAIPADRDPDERLACQEPPSASFTSPFIQKD
jgi:hypothetical protein